MRWSNALVGRAEPPGGRARGGVGPLAAATAPWLCLLLLAAGCRALDPGDPSAGAGTADLARPSAAELARPPSAAASVSPRPGRLAPVAGGPAAAPGVAPEAAAGAAEERCDAGFRAGADPAADAARLGLLCGPSSGLALLAAANGAVGEDGPVVPFRWEAEAGECFRVVAAAGEGAMDVAVTVELPGGGHLLAATGERWAVAPADGLICPPAGRPLTARVRTHAGRGRAALEIWRGRGLAERAQAPGAKPPAPRADATPRTHAVH